jgi:hypothetical protein
MATSHKRSLTTGGVPGSDPDWPGLIGQAVDDVSRIVHSEADILQVKMGEAVRSGTSKSLRVVALVALFIWGAGCILLASILLLHEWVPLWQALAVVGLFTMSIGGVGSGMIGRRQRLNRNSQ